MIIAFLSYCFNKDIVDTITNTQARMLLQKNKMNTFESQVMEIWIATQNLSFLFMEFSKNKENRKSNSIAPAYKHWKALKENWTANFPTNYKYISKLQRQKTEKYCFNKKGFFTDLEHQFKCVIKKAFEERFF